MNMKNLSILLLLAVFFNCSKDDNGGRNNPPPIADPVASVLTFPDNNQECNQGVEVNPTQSRVTFTWNASDNTDSYELVLRNLENNSTTNHISSTNQVDITLLKGTPYSWYVISKSTNTPNTAESSTWRFYNAGDAVQSYAPFPADVVAPAMGANLNGVTNVTLEWSGHDVDNDITGYDIYFDTTSPPVAQLGSTQTALTADAVVSSGTVYYWRIITKDSQDNNSQSTIFEFRVD